MAAERCVPEHVTRHAYWLVVALPLLLPWSWSLRDLPFFAAWFSWLPLAVLYFVIPLADWLIGRDATRAEVSGARFYPDTLVPVAAGVSHLLALAWGVSIADEVLAGYGVVALLGWLFSLGDISATVGINVAHELIHRRNRGLRGLGTLMLASVWYPGFTLEHPRWHHVHVATPEDPSSAAAGSTVYRQVPRALCLNTRQAWRLGRQAAGRRGRPFPGLLNEVAAGFGLSLLLTVAAGLAWGALAAWMLLLQGVIAAALLEVINYIEHYGLRRARRPDGRYEPPGLAHSWDCDYWLSNVILIQLPRHADHHTHPSREFSRLRLSGESPRLPLGYPLLVLIAFLPPLWRRVVHPHLPSRRAAAVG